MTREHNGKERLDVLKINFGITIIFYESVDTIGFMNSIK